MFQHVDCEIPALFLTSQVDFGNQQSQRKADSWKPRGRWPAAPRAPGRVRPRQQSPDYTLPRRFIGKIWPSSLFQSGINSTIAIMKTVLHNGRRGLLCAGVFFLRPAPGPWPLLSIRPSRCRRFSPDPAHRSRQVPSVLYPHELPVSLANPDTR